MTMKATLVGGCLVSLSEILKVKN